MFHVLSFKIKIFASIMIAAGLIASSIFFIQVANANVIQTSVTVTVCGNSVVETGEQCDDGNVVSNDGCSSSCQTDEAISICGNSTVESGEQCDDGNTNSGDGCSVTCQTEAPAPSGGGGGGGAPPPAPISTSVILKGKAYPYSDITILKDGGIVAITLADSQANFNVQVSGITAGTYTFGLWAEDDRGERSITFSFTTSVAAGTITTIGGIFLPPTIGTDKTSVARGDIINFLGQTAPKSDITLHVNSEHEVVRKFTADAGGLWSYAFDTTPLEEGSHISKSKATSPDGLLSGFSKIISFVVGKKGEEVIKGADLNGDGKVNLIDFSILLFNWGALSNPAADFNNDGTVSIVDFSILLFWWTG